MIWRGLGVLAGTAALIVIGVVGLARLTVPDEPTFEETLRDAEESGGGIADFVPTAIGGQLTVSGASESTIELERQVSGPSYGLGDSQSRVFFETNPLTISQMSHDGLAFFPEPGDCEFTEGEHNEGLGLVAVQISCPELVDIRDNGTISLEGVAALPSDLVLELDLPEMGGTVTIGDTDITFDDDLVLLVGPSFQGSGSQEIGLTATSDDPMATLRFPYDMESESLRLANVAYGGGSTPIDPGECSTDVSELMVINPQARILEMSIACDGVQLANLGNVEIEGSLVFQQIFLDES